MTDNTILVLAGAGVTPYSARGLTQSLTPIQQASQLRRTVSGALSDVSAEQFRKYASQVNGDDQAPPAVDQLWPGAVLVVDCIAELAVALDGTELLTDEDTEGLNLGRPAVEGSLRVEDGFAYYRPRLSMMVAGFSMEADEWAAGVRWTLDLEEV